MGMEPCGWVAVLCKDGVQSGEKSLLCGWSEVFEEMIVDVVGSRASVSGAMNGELQFKECEGLVIGEEIDGFVRIGEEDRNRIGNL